MTPAVPGAPGDIPPPSWAELWDGAPCGYVTTRLDGTIVAVNQRVLDWTGFSRHDLVEHRRLLDLLRVGGRIYYETHVAPRLQLGEAIDEVAFELLAVDGAAVPVIASFRRVASADGVPAHVRTMLLDARGRQAYEQHLRDARVRAEESEGRADAVAHALQRSLLSGGLGSGAGFQVVSRYRPAVTTLDVGGDWYDSFAIDDATVSISVGDVVGRGLAAASAMGQIRSALRAISGDDAGPARVLDRLDQFVTRVPGGRMATVAVIEVEPATGHLRYASAGHIPALVVDPDGTTRLLWEGRSPPLDAIPLDDPRPESTTTVRPGSRILLCTDGLIERAGRDIDEGLDAWAASAAGLLGADPDTMVDQMMTDLLADEVTPDDVCLVCLALT